MSRRFQAVDEADPALLESLQRRVEEGFLVQEVLQGEGKALAFRVETKGGQEEAFSRVLRSFEETDYYPLYRESGGERRILIAQRQGKDRHLRPLFHLLLFAATLLTTTLAGYLFWTDGDLRGSLLFALSLMAILGFHELGHALAARRRGIRATLPFFLPAPPPIPFGTFGAVIFMNSPIPNRKSLLDVGMAGPLAGFFVALPILFLGIRLSHAVPLEQVLEESEFLLGPNLLFYVLARATFRDFEFLDLHPLAISGWIGLFVTALNLLPMGQLDGGHILRGLAPRRARKVSWGVALLLLAGGLFLWPGWIFWVFLVYLLTRMDHPGPLDDVSGIDRRRKLLVLLVLLVLLLSFIPVPILPAQYLNPELLKK
jgi:membrane-associated protease RseP (regulator of RpoE activity)